MTEKVLIPVAEVAAQAGHGPLARKTLEFLMTMQRIVNLPKQPAITPADWAPLGELLDREKFHRIGNFGESVNWSEYAELLTRWANSSWYAGYIWRLREAPASPGKPGVVYVESEERSNTEHPVREDGDYQTLASIGAWQFDDEGLITALHIYDQRPM
jgi:hypothetical protein